MTKSQEQEQDIVTGNEPPRRFFGSLHHTLLLVVVCGLCVLGAIGYVAWHARTAQESTPSTRQLINAYEKGKASRTPEKAINDLSNVDETKATPEELARIYSLRGQAYQTKGDAKAALAAYEKAVSYSHTQNVSYETMGGLAFELAEYPKAATYYQKALDFARNQPQGQDPMLASHLIFLEKQLERAQHAE
ncbi:MAG: tetratricopeptide repeat protein [Candidatus Saccharimonadales bacterium]